MPSTILSLAVRGTPLQLRQSHHVRINGQEGKGLAEGGWVKRVLGASGGGGGGGGGCREVNEGGKKRGEESSEGAVFHALTLAYPRPARE